MEKSEADYIGTLREEAVIWREYLNKTKGG